MAVHRVMLIVEVVELTIDIDEVSVPVVGDGKTRGEIQGHAVVARMLPRTLNHAFVLELVIINIDALFF